MSITPKNWQVFQHYRDRKPPWIKLHRELLDDFKFFGLPVASRALAPCLWLLASEYFGGRITASDEEVCFRLHLGLEEYQAAIKPLVDKGFFIVESDTLADCKRGAMPETEGEREKQEEAEKRRGERPSGNLKRKQEAKNVTPTNSIIEASNRVIEHFKADQMRPEVRIGESWDPVRLLPKG